MTDKTKTLLSFFVPYSFIAAACWHLPYWSTFDINPFEYMGLNDIIMSFIYPLVFSILAVILPGQVGTFIGNALSPKKNKREEIVAGEEKANNNKVTEMKTNSVRGTKNRKTFFSFLRNFEFWYQLFIWIICIGILAMMFTSDKDTKWLGLPVLLQILICLYLIPRDFLDEYFPSGYKGTIIFFSTLILTFSIINGKQKAIDVRDCRAYEYTYDLNISNERLKVLGKLGDFMVLTTIGNERKYIIPLGNKNNFELRSYNQTKK